MSSLRFSHPSRNPRVQDAFTTLVVEALTNCGFVPLLLDQQEDGALVLDGFSAMDAFTFRAILRAMFSGTQVQVEWVQ